MLYSNVPEELMKDIYQLVPDAGSIPDEYWRIVPDTEEGWIYSISSKRDIVIRHTRVDRLHRIFKPMILTLSLDCCTYFVSIRRSRKDLSTYIEHVRYDAFPELNEVKTADDDSSEAVDMPYEGIEWYGRKKSIVHMLPVSESDMHQVRLFYPEDLPRELWAYVPGTNRKYVISTQSRGVILKHYSLDGRIIKPQIWQLASGGHNRSYYDCCITVGDHQVNTVSHQQVLKSFVMKPGTEYEVNHIDGDRHNNILDNLEWVTRQENSDHYNLSPEMEYKRKVGYKKISEFGKAHQKEIQNRPEVNAKRSKTLKEGWNDRRRKQSSEANKSRWNSLSEAQKMSQTSGLRRYTQAKHEDYVLRNSIDESKISS